MSNISNSANNSNTQSIKQEGNYSLYILYGFLFILFLSIGIFIVRYSNKYNKRATAKVIESNCDKIKLENKEYTCTLKIEYFLNSNTKAHQIIKSSNLMYNVGDDIVIYYKEDEPSDVRIKANSDYIIGYGLIVISILILLVCILSMMGVLKPIMVTKYSNSPYYPNPHYYQNYMTPEQTFASSFGLSLGSRIANKI